MVPAPAFATLRAVATLRLHRRIWTWLALVAMLGLAFAPTVSRAMSAAAPWLQVCSAGHDGAPPAGSHDHRLRALDHCALCAVAAAPLGMPPAVANVVPPAGLGHHRPLLFFRSPRPLFAWTGPHSRAPPARS